MGHGRTNVPKKIKFFTHNEIIDRIPEEVVSKAKLWIHGNFPLAEILIYLVKVNLY